MNTQLNDPAATAREKSVRIWCRAPPAGQVFLAGTFNDWSPTATPMKRMGDTRRAEVSVVPGLYSYNFVIDGRWVCDLNHMEPHGGGPCRLLITHWLG